ncbi:unnamed protein product [Paramecium sonneborni]|uniref:VWFA domain-containing protein n=1 Tax=Paramecium sonneborni TaxID=65129 RepID=A0A8S1N343_9CILI|nr:unnamed protein product [Paramecium sonneborni]
MFSKTKDQENDCKQNRIGFDLIFLIDKIGSIEGDKLQSMKQSLNILLEFLIDQDRLQLIIFDSQALKSSSLKMNNKNDQIIFYLAN